MPGPTVTIALQPEPVAVVLDFVDPLRAVGDVFGAARDAWFKRELEHVAYLGGAAGSKTRYRRGLFIPLRPSERPGLLQRLLAGQHVRPHPAGRDVVPIDEFAPAVGKPDFERPGVFHAFMAAASGGGV